MANLDFLSGLAGGLEGGLEGFLEMQRLRHQLSERRERFGERALERSAEAGRRREDVEFRERESARRYELSKSDEDRKRQESSIRRFMLETGARRGRERVPDDLSEAIQYRRQLVAEGGDTAELDSWLKKRFELEADDKKAGGAGGDKKDKPAGKGFFGNLIDFTKTGAGQVSRASVAVGRAVRGLVGGAADELQGRKLRYLGPGPVQGSKRYLTPRPAKEATWWLNTGPARTMAEKILEKKLAEKDGNKK